MSDMKFSEEHEWIRVDGEVGTIGITDYAQEQLGDVVFVELPEVGREVTKDAEVAVVESVKTASDIFVPVSGTVVEVNEALVDNPATVNESPYDDGWFFKVKLSNATELDDLMDEAGYKSFVEGLD